MNNVTFLQFMEHFVNKNRTI